MERRKGTVESGSKEIKSEKRNVIGGGTKLEEGKIKEPKKSREGSLE